MTYPIPAGVTTAEWWDIDGEPLNKFGWNVETVGGSRYAVPPMRGDDAQYAYVPGREWHAKLPDSRTITLAMWITGVDPDTGNATGDQMLRWNDSWNFLRRLFWQPERQFVLTRRWLLTDEDNIPRIRTASAHGQLTNTLDLNMTGRFRGTFQADILLADPFFYGGEVISQINMASSGVVHNPGDFRAGHQHFSVQFVGPLNHPELVNVSTSPHVSVKLDTTVAAGEVVTLDVGTFTATSTVELLTTTGAGTYNRLVYVKHSGAHEWFGLTRGDNTLVLAGQGSTGHAVVRFQPPYV